MSKPATRQYSNVDREIFLEAMRHIQKYEDALTRYARIIGRVQGLLHDDQEIVDAIEAAFSGSRSPT